MFLAIDIGNTNITFGLLENRITIATARIATRQERTDDETRWFLNNFLNEHNASNDIQAVGIASVVFQITPTIEHAIHDLLPEAKCDVVGKTIIPKITIAYEPPSTVGIDRLCNVIAGMKRWGAPLIVVDFGTATTIDAVDANGVYLGGAIAPGIETSLHALASRTSQLYSVSMELPVSPIGKNTADAMRSGLLWGALYAAEGLAQKFAVEICGNPKVIATGGFASLLVSKSRIISENAPNLVLEGIELICSEK